MHRESGTPTQVKFGKMNPFLVYSNQLFLILFHIQYRWQGKLKSCKGKVRLKILGAMLRHSGNLKGQLTYMEIVVLSS